MKKFFSKIRPYISFSKKSLFSALLFVGVLFTLYHKRPAQAHHDDNRAARRGFLGGITGGAVVGGLTRSPAGAVAGVAGGALIGSSTARRSSDRRINSLYKKRDRLKRDIREAKTDKHRARHEKDLTKVNEDISKRESKINR